MSFLSLPIEILREIIGYCHLPCAKMHEGNLLFVCSRLHEITIPILYAHPRVWGYHRIRKFCKTLQLIPSRTTMIKTLYVTGQTHDGDPACHMVLPNQLFIPILSKCTELCVEPITIEHSLCIMPLPVIMFWASQCPILRTLRVDKLSIQTLEAFQPCVDHGEEGFPTLDDLGITLPFSLSSLYLEDCMFTHEDLPTDPQIRALCGSWARVLVIDCSDSCVDMEYTMDLNGLQAFSDNLRSLTLVGQAWQYGRALEVLGDALPQLEELNCALGDYEITTTFSRLRNFRTILIFKAYEEHGDEESAVSHLSHALEQDKFPALEVLNVAGDTPRFATAVRNTKLGDTCRKRNITATMQFEFDTEFSDQVDSVSTLLPSRDDYPFREDEDHDS